MRTILLNAGPLVSFGNKGGFDIEKSVLSSGMGIVIEAGQIVEIKPSQELSDEYGVMGIGNANKDVRIMDLFGCAVIPGLIDSHTHLLWAGDRSQEVRWRREGMSYGDIAQRGGGIQHTVRETRQATDEDLFELGYTRLREALRTGTTHLETKSGYGLSTESELRLLSVAHRLGELQSLPSLDLTWMGAHDVPSGFTKEAYVEHLLSEQLPAVVEQGYARSADVFCEPGWFDTGDSEDILSASRHAGLDLRMHIDEFVDGGGGDLAASLNVETADHAYHTPIESRLAMRDSGVTTGFLPGTPYAMGDSWPEMNEIMDNHIPFTLATDFNPNCRTLSLPFMASLMVQRCNMHPLQALYAITAGAADTTPHPTGQIHGRLVEGAVANLNIVDGPFWEAVTLQPTGTPFKASILNGHFISH